MAAVFKDQFVGLIVSSVLFFMNVSSMTTKSSKPYSASFKSGGLRLFKPGRSPVTILIPVKRLDSDEAAADEARNSTSDGRSARSPLVIRLLEEQEPQQPPPPRYTQAIFPAPEDAIHRDEQPAGDPAEQLLQVQTRATRRL
ncbi:uncharacterized protein LOC134528490 [Bacillus rossius redtenbacheri]|uniref:uncharacterized protein LOC134528490 n=1 Tax=Bacillus rossius redtenbacheri TaxID=93214 RepID=UPI002FDD5378